MKKQKSKKLTSMKKTVKSEASPDLDVLDAENEFSDDSLDLLNEEVWEFMNSEDEIWEN